MKKESLTQNYYDGIARGYSNLYHEEQRIKISKIKKYLPADDCLVLDLGCGDGVLNEFVSGSDVVSLDLSFELLKLNKNKCKVLGSAMNLPFKDGVFDYVISFTMLQDAPDSVRVLEEVSRVLKKDGIVILSFLRFSSQLDKILERIESEFKVTKRIEEEKDYLFVLKK